MPPIHPIPDRCAFALELADAADAITTRWFRGGPDVERKADGSLVTRADREAEAELRRRIGAAFPHDAILGEEEGGALDADVGDGDGRWILDPIDGTHGFARGMPIFATLIAFERAGVVEVGVASAPALGVRWWAARGAGAWRVELAGGREPESIATSAVDRVADAQILFGTWGRAADRWPGFEALVRAAWRDRGLGDFWGHCLVAEGAAEAMLDPSVSVWDVAALVPIVEEAGGRMSGDGNAPVLGAGHAITSNGPLHDALLEALTPPEAAPPRA